MAGIKDTQEVLDLVEVFGVFIAKQLKDGFQGKDIGALFDALQKDPAFVKAIAGALEGIQNVPGELVDTDLFEGIKLGNQAYGMVSKIAAALK